MPDRRHGRRSRSCTPSSRDPATSDCDVSVLRWPAEEPAAPAARRGSASRGSSSSSPACDPPSRSTRSRTGCGRPRTPPTSGLGAHAAAAGRRRRRAARRRSTTTACCGSAARGWTSPPRRRRWCGCSLEHLERVVRYDTVGATYESAGRQQPRRLGAHAADPPRHPGATGRVSSWSRCGGAACCSRRSRRRSPVRAERRPAPRGAAGSGAAWRSHPTATSSVTRSTSSAAQLGAVLVGDLEAVDHQTVVGRHVGRPHLDAARPRTTSPARGAARADRCTGPRTPCATATRRCRRSPPHRGAASTAIGPSAAASMSVGQRVGIGTRARAARGTSRAPHRRATWRARRRRPTRLVVGQHLGDGGEPADLVLPRHVDPPPDVVGPRHVDARRAGRAAGRAGERGAPAPSVGVRST